MKKFIILLAVLMLASFCMAQKTIYSKPDANWWSGSLAKDVAWRWAKDIDNRVAGASQLGTGNIFYVDSNVTTEGNGTTVETAKDTLEEIVPLLTANNGDVVYVLQGHNEPLTGADGVDLDVAGVTIIGLGNGTDRPRFDYDNSAGEFVIGAANVRITNLTFLPSVTGITHAIDIENAGDWAIIDHCEILLGETVNTDEFTDTIQVGTTATNVLIYCNKMVHTTSSSACNNFVDLSAATISNPMIIGNYVFGNFEEAPIWGGAAIPTECVIAYNNLTNLESGDLSIEFAGNATGNCLFNTMNNSSIATALDPGLMKCFENYAGDGTDSARITPPLADNTANYIGFNSNDNSAVTTTVVSNANGSVVERLEYIQAQAAYWQAKGIVMTATAHNDDLFDVDNGSIEILSLTGVVTTEIGAGTNTLAIVLDADIGFIDSDFSTAVDIDGDVVGTRYLFSNATESVLTPISDTAGNTNPMESWFCGKGMIEQVSQGTPAGVIVWYMVYRPIDVAVTVIAQ